VRDTARFEAHQSSASRIGSNGIIRKHDFAHVTLSTIDRAIASLQKSHLQTTKRIGTVADIQNVFLNACLMEGILGPSAWHPRHNAEQVLHAQREWPPQAYVLFLRMPTDDSAVPWQQRFGRHPEDGYRETVFAVPVLY
jgi:hypothetical protein